MNDEIKVYATPILEYLRECVEDDIIFETSNCKALLDYIINLQQENERLKEELNRMFNRKVNAIKYIGREMIHYALYPASKVDGMKIIELLNGGDEE